MKNLTGKLSNAVFIVFVFLFSSQLFSEEISVETPVNEKPESWFNNINFTVRWGAGGFNDSRSPVGQLGGDQFALDIRLKELPVSVLLSGEFYTNSPEPTHQYEIADLWAVNILYHTDFPYSAKVSLFMGGGIGGLGVPESESNPNTLIKNNLINAEFGAYLRPYNKFGFYGLLKYLYSERTINSVRVIDFDESIFLIGIIYDF